MLAKLKQLGDQGWELALVDSSGGLDNLLPEAPEIVPVLGKERVPNAKGDKALADSFPLDTPGLDTRIPIRQVAPTCSDVHGRDLRQPAVLPRSNTYSVPRGTSAKGEELPHRTTEGRSGQRPSILLR